MNEKTLAITKGMELVQEADGEELRLSDIPADGTIDASTNECAIQTDEEIGVESEETIIT